MFVSFLSVYLFSQVSDAYYEYYIIVTKTGHNSIAIIKRNEPKLRKNKIKTQTWCISATIPIAIYMTDSVAAEGTRPTKVWLTQNPDHLDLKPTINPIKNYKGKGEYQKAQANLKINIVMQTCFTGNHT